MKVHVSLVALLLLVVAGCSGGSTSPSILVPAVKPIVVASLPAGLRPPSLVARRLTSIPAFTDLADRFFRGNGPTDLLDTLLPNIDQITAALNSPTLQGACLTQTPVAYQITPFGSTVDMVAQCYVQGTPSYIGDPALLQFGTDSNGVINVYSANGAEWGAYKFTPITGTTQYSVEAWIGLGYANAPSGCGAVQASAHQQAYPAQWDTCSYGVMHLTANPVTHITELSVAGLGFGYCGVQLISDGNNINVAGSGDMGATCGNLLTACFAADAVSTGTCSAPALTFSLAAMGRGPNPVQLSLTACNSPAFDQSLVDISPQQCTCNFWGVSSYPSSNPNIVLNGTNSDALYFGPTTPTTGVGQLVSH